MIYPPPVAKNNENWPLLTVSKGFFEGAIQTKAKATAKTDLAMAEISDDGEEVEAEGWGDDDSDKQSGDEEKVILHKIWFT
jgi:coatomer protein complex subunit alpha (xenin)